MQIENNTTALVAYKIYADRPDGTLIEFFNESDPKQIIFGYDQQIDGFEKGLMGKDIGKFSFEIEPVDAFGTHHEELKIWIPKDAFLDQGELRSDLMVLGNQVNMLDKQGRKLSGIVKDIGNDSIFMDFNHPLAGKKLFVTGEVISIRPVNDRDLVSMQSHSCGCGSECGCGSGESQDEGSCCSTNDSSEAECEVCGNPPDKMGQGIGNCQCAS